MFFVNLFLSAFSPLKRLIKWLFESPKRLAIFALIIVACLAALTIRNLKAELAEATTQLTREKNIVRLERAAHQETKAAYAAAQQAATALAMEVRDDVETSWKGRSDDTERRFKDRVDLALRDARRMRGRGDDSALGRPGGPPDPAEASSPAAESGGTGGMPPMDEDDVRICTINTVKALEWQAFHEGLRADLERAGAIDP